MVMRTIGDQARAYTLQSSGAKLKNSLQVLTQELNTGRVSDVGQRLGGNTRTLSAIESRVSLLTGFRQTTSEAATLAEAAQSALGAVQGAADQIAAGLLADGGSVLTTVMDSQSRQAGQAFEEAVSRLNTSVAGLHLFGGVNTDTAPVIPGKQILDELAVQVSSLATSGDIAQFVQSWFDAPAGGGGYQDFAYRGSVGKARTVQGSEHDVISVDIDAANPAIRKTLAGLALAALPARGILAGQPTEQRDLLNAASTRMLNASGAMTTERARVGFLQGQIERMQTENASETASLEIARNILVEADPYETATALKQVETQMEMLYTITARLSTLKLVDYLR